MIFNSIEFAIFLPIVYCIYWFLLKGRTNWQNAFIILSGFVFYGWWDWRFLFLLLFTALVDYFIGRSLGVVESIKKRKLLLTISVLCNIGLLGFFKYYNFFVDSFVSAFRFFGYQPTTDSLQLILPVGISFYTFQSLGYSIDAYRRKLQPEKNVITFLGFVSFFPQLLAGPIERATNMLPQFRKERKFDYNQSVDGLKQVLWGLFKKVVIADNCASWVNMAFDNPHAYNGTTLFVAALLFAFQIYGDFSGYSDMACGIARLFGFQYMQNFNYPYFSRTISEFWRRWHISLSTWFRDYVYFPLGGSAGSMAKTIRNTMIIFLVSGFWHGANWTYIAWGAINGLYFLPGLISRSNRKYLDIIGNSGRISTIEWARMLFTFFLTTMAWIYFRARSIQEANAIVYEILFNNKWQLPQFMPTAVFAGIAILLLIEWMGRRNPYPIQHFFVNSPTPVRWGFYCLICLSIYFFGGREQTFIYFQF
ncbi:MBOAT family O-acyltransferase [Flavihumibacter sp. CACIAM 22H1]|uniref:MBOAT family O-acyltransferase n=1 Tax=Flavihumibacter sp. CACIAM 22H1 TaxID=1812911 RepID=UPI0007A8F83B|nr:MBOAT family O-acyltransferase [Flavihumibacter sp. CACIAM 22H1]KYP15147.1 MAG: acyltransferase [Flavihumibacter sp. CACIAM 22H1]